MHAKIRVWSAQKRAGLSPMPVYEGEDDEARHQLTCGRNSRVAVPNFGKHVPLRVSLWHA